jgi:hypothetical protein
MSNSSTFTIIGASQTGGWIAKTLCAEGFEGRIVLMGGEKLTSHNMSACLYRRPPCYGRGRGRQRLFLAARNLRRTQLVVEKSRIIDSFDS